MQRKHVSVEQDRLSRAIVLLSEQIRRAEEVKITDASELKKQDSPRAAALTLQQQYLRKILQSLEERQELKLEDWQQTDAAREAARILKEGFEQDRSQITALKGIIASCESESQAALFTFDPLGQDSLWEHSVLAKLDLILRGAHFDLFEEAIQEIKIALQKLAERNIGEAIRLTVELELGLAKIYSLYDLEQAYKYSKKAFRHAEEGLVNSWLNANFQELKGKALQAYQSYLAQLQNRRDLFAGFAEGQALVAESNEKIKYVLTADRIVSQMSQAEENLYKSCDELPEQKPLVIEQQPSSADVQEDFQNKKQAVLAGTASFALFYDWCESLFKRMQLLLGDSQTTTVEVEEAIAEMDSLVGQIDKYIINRYQQFLLTDREYSACRQFLVNVQDHKTVLQVKLLNCNARDQHPAEYAINENLNRLSLQGGDPNKRSLWDRRSSAPVISSSPTLGNRQIDEVNSAVTKGMSRQT